MARCAAQARARGEPDELTPHPNPNPDPDPNSQSNPNANPNQASLTTRTIVSLVYILLPKMVVVLACFAYTRQRSTRDLRLHLLLNVLSVTLAPLVRVG